MSSALGGDRDDRDGIVGLVRETADGLSELVADHVRLARTELIADAKAYAQRAVAMLVAGLVLALGYALACVAGALALARVIGAPLAFLSVAGFHLVVGAILMLTGARRAPAGRPMQETATEVSRTMATLARTAGATGNRT
jgi:hypothetical protein